MFRCKKLFKHKQLTKTENAIEPKQELILDGKWMSGKWNFKLVDKGERIIDGKWMDGKWNFKVILDGKRKGGKWKFKVVDVDERMDGS